MITDTLLVVGPGGIGKSPLDRGLRADVGRIDPYRLRKAGPRASRDVFYAHPRLRDELYFMYQRLGVSLTYLTDTVHWFPAASTLFLKVRDEWQLLLLEALPLESQKPKYSRQLYQRCSRTRKCVAGSAAYQSSF